MKGVTFTVFNKYGANKTPGFRPGVFIRLRNVYFFSSASLASMSARFQRTASLAARGLYSHWPSFTLRLLTTRRVRNADKVRVFKLNAGAFVTVVNSTDTGPVPPVCRRFRPRVFYFRVGVVVNGHQVYVKRSDRRGPDNTVVVVALFNGGGLPRLMPMP